MEFFRIRGCKYSINRFGTPPFFSMVHFLLPGVSHGVESTLIGYRHKPGHPAEQGFRKGSIDAGRLS